MNTLMQTDSSDLPDFPIAVDGLTDAWATRLLRLAGELAPNASARVASAAPLGEPGQTGRVFRVEVLTDAADDRAPLALIVKMAPVDDALRQRLHALGSYRREVGFYRAFPQPGIPTPRCYEAQLHEPSGHFLLVLEAIEAGVLGDIWQGMSPAALGEAVDALAAFHARWWCSPELRRHASWLPQHDDMVFFQQRLGAAYRAALPVVMARHPEHFGGYLGAVAERLAQRWDAWSAQRPGDAFTLIHGDFHPKQLFFSDPDGSGAERGRFVAFDWQTVCAGDPAIDLARLLVKGLGPAELRAHGGALIERYHRGLREAGISMQLATLERAVASRMLVTLYVTVFILANTGVETLEAAAAQRGVDYRARLLGDLEVSLRDFGAFEGLDEIQARCA